MLEALQRRHALLTLGPAGWFQSVRSFWPRLGADADMMAAACLLLLRVLSTVGAPPASVPPTPAPCRCAPLG